jgi:hypothetical protein
LSDALAVICIVAFTLAPEEGAVTVTVGCVVSGTVFETVTATGADVALLPAASRATAVSVCVPLLVVVVFHETEKGATTSSVPRAAPSRRNLTPATPVLSDAVAVT